MLRPAWRCALEAANKLSVSTTLWILPPGFVPAIRDAPPVERDEGWPYRNIDVQFLTVTPGSNFAVWLANPDNQRFFAEKYVVVQADFWRIFLLSQYARLE